MGFRGLFLLLATLIALPAGVTSLASSWIAGAGSGWTTEFPSSATASSRKTQPLDADSDGRLSRAEHAAAAQVLFRGLDLDEDGIVTPVEREEARERAKVSTTAAPAAAASIAEFDPNRDALCSAREHAVAARSLFVRLDLDTDGYVTMDEVRQARATRQEKRTI